MVYLRQNLPFLYRYHPHLYHLLKQERKKQGVTFEIKETRSGDRTVLVQGRPLHSQVDPQREARSLLREVQKKDANQTVFYLGCGLGYFLKQLDQDLPREKTIVILSPSAKLFFETLKRHSLERVLSSPKVLIFIDADIDRIKQRLASFVITKQIQEFQILKSHNEVELWKDYYLKAEEMIREFAAIVKKNKEDLFAMAETLNQVIIQKKAKGLKDICEKIQQRPFDQLTSLERQLILLRQLQV